MENINTWKKVKLNDVCEIYGGSTPLTSNKRYWDGDVVWLSPSDLPEIGEISHVKSSLRKITKTALKESSITVLPQGSVVYSTRASIGKIGIADVDLTTNQGFTNFICKENINNKFLCYSLKFFTPQIAKLSNSTTFSEVSRTSIKNFKIPLPPLPTQKRIAEILDKVDTLRKKGKQLLQYYDDLAQSLFIDMFGDPVKNEKGWVISSLGDVCFYIKDGPHVSPKYTSSGIPFISVNNIIKGAIDITNARYISKEDYKDYSKKGKPEKGDILYTKGGTTGFAKRVDVDFEFMNWVHIAILKFNKGIINEIFLEYMLNSSYCYAQSQRLTKGIANRDLVLGEMKKIKILLPPLNKQHRFSQQARNIEQQKEKLKAQIQESENLFQALLQKAFNGGLN